MMHTLKGYMTSILLPVVIAGYRVHTRLFRRSANPRDRTSHEDSVMLSDSIHE